MGAGRGVTNAGRSQQFFRFRGDCERHSPSVAEHRCKLQLSAGDGASRNPGSTQMPGPRPRRHAGCSNSSSRLGSPPSNRRAVRSDMAATPMPSARRRPANTKCSDPSLPQRDSQAARRPDGKRRDGRGLHQVQCGCPEPAARPCTQRGRALHCAFSRRWRRRAADLARRQQSECARLALFFARGGGQFLDFLRSPSGAPRSVAQVRDILTAALRCGARNSQGGSTAVCASHGRSGGNIGAGYRRHCQRVRRRSAGCRPGGSGVAEKGRRRSCLRRRSPIDRSSRCSAACSPMPAPPAHSHRS